MNRTPILSGRSLIFYALIAGCTWIAAQCIQYYQSLEESFRKFGAPEKIKIESGMGVREIGDLLTQKGLIESPWHFVGAAWLKKSLRQLQAGEYYSAKARSPRDWVKLLQEGKIIRYRITIPEGWNTEQIAFELEKAGLSSMQSFLESNADPRLLSLYNIRAQKCDGYLYPETYFFEKPVSADEIVETFVEEFNRRIQPYGLVSHEQVILASIIQKEARDPNDMKKVSAVFHNRLRRNQSLESDATLLYALSRDNRTEGPLDTDYPSPYNTYRVVGLPAGPICNPGLEALDAAIHPAKGDWVFFLSDRDGVLHFSKTFKEHVRLKRKYL